MNEGEEIRFIDLFSGIGGFRLGLERANNRMEKDGVESNISRRNFAKPQTISTSKEERTGHFRCVWSCDWNKYANQVYVKHFGEADHYSGDIRGVDTGDIPDFDLLCAGFPCQSFSVAGKGKGFQDTRGTLFYEISRIAEAKRPQMLLLENVKGLLSNDRGKTFETILQELGRIGYWVEWQVLNSKHHGVPQNRERVFIVGHSRKGGGREIFPIGETDEVAERESRGRPPVQPEVSTAIDGSYYKGVDRHGQRTVVLDPFNRGAKEEEAYSLKTNPSITSSPIVAVSFTNPHNSEEERRVNLSDTSRTVKPPYGNQQPLVMADRPRTLAGKGRNLETPKPITNALSGVQKDNRLLEDLMIRRLTPVECERLQNFPDNWTKWGVNDNGEEVRLSDTQRYKMLGNAVTTSVITFLGRRIMESLQ